MQPFRLPSVQERPVAVLGGGVLGRRIASMWAAAAYSVNIHDPSQEQRAAALAYCEENNIDKLTHGTVKAFADLAPAVDKAWLVVEAVPEKLQLKQSIFKELEKLTEKDALLGSNSSSYKTREVVDGLDMSTKRRALNMHYFMPPQINIVELMTDGSTDETIFPFLVDKLKHIGLSPYVARKESTGLIINRLWAAVKRESLNILAEDISTPEELDKIWVEFMAPNRSRGPVSMMDEVGLDTVSFIEEHYIKERNLPDTPVRFLSKYISEGRLGTKSSKGGLHGPQPAATEQPYLYFLDLARPTSTTSQELLNSGRILVGSPDGRPLKTLVTGQRFPDGIDVSKSAGKLFWTSMGTASQNDGAILSASLDGSNIQEIVPRGIINTPKQLAIDHQNAKLYFCDREGMSVYRCNFDGSQLDVIIRAGDSKNDQERADCTRWCVGIAVSPANGKFYWTQKGPSKGGKGRILQANIDFKSTENVDSRTDIEVLFQNLPEPIDLEIDEEDNTLWWTDRGELPFGNSINCSKLDGYHKLPPKHTASQPGKDYTIVARNLHEAIGIKLDKKNRHIYATDLGGAVYRFDMDGRNKMKLYEEQGIYSGLTIAFN